MRDLVIAGGFALILAGLMETMLEFLGVADPILRWIIIAVIFVVGIAMAVIGIILKTKKRPWEETPGIIDGGKEKGYRSLEPNVFRRIIDWLKTH